jgi:acetyl-CoA carboxylase carboxyltransferase component
MKNGDLQFNKNEDGNLLLLSEVRQRFEKIKLGGGKKNIARQHERGKLTARERIQYLLDKDTPQFEMGAFAGFEMYEGQGGCPAAGVIVVIGYISGKQCIVVANDATVKAGAWFPITAKKNLRAQEIAMENRLPIMLRMRSRHSASSLHLKSVTPEISVCVVAPPSVSLSTSSPIAAFTK